ncbi:hypothetical protein [Clostridium baratii]|uniref:Uncharacterized protein n=1 Tax=Clostridium baratii TaxID=1561 RepID=A0A174QMD7_9CLOT|nr:hypothetical protein [Clostridium baratii]CUP74402.1 Uncharacterised protein [Clostridium baratii]
MINEIQKEIFNLVPEAIDEVPADFNFKKDNAIEIKIADNITNKFYLDDITLQIRIVGLKNNKFNIQDIAENLDKKFNKARFINCRVVRENAWYTSYYDEDKFNAVLQYLIKRI